jgi:protein-disulfide isomerase
VTTASPALSLLFLAAFVALVLPLAACRGEVPDPNNSAAAADVALPGVDTRDFTPREKRELSRYLAELPSPCPDVAVPIAQCVLDKRACPACLPAAILIAKAVRDGMAPGQVQDLYKERYDSAARRTIPLDGSPSRGPESAAVTLVEFADFECPFCQRLAPELDALWEKRKGAVRFVYKFMPLSMHPHGEIAARAAIAAYSQGKFWEMHRQLFANGEHLDQNALDAYAKTLGLDVDRFREDMQSPATSARIDADRKLADTLGVKGTPTLYINGREYDMKLDMSDWIDAEIAAKQKVEPR